MTTDLIIHRASGSPATFYEGMKLTGKGNTDSFTALIEERKKITRSKVYRHDTTDS